MAMEAFKRMNPEEEKDFKAVLMCLRQGERYFVKHLLLEITAVPGGFLFTQYSIETGYNIPRTTTFVKNPAPSYYEDIDPADYDY